jgi:Terminase RNaseH-like domain/Terminase large subunit, T4likevirus-type, N-terminal
MNVHNCIALLLDPSRILLAQGLSPDPWQRALLFAPDRQLLLNCSRQSGKSTTVSALALHTALFTPGGLVLLLSPSQRQSGEIFRKVLLAYRALGRPLKAVQETQTVLELENRSRIICLPGREGTIRSFSGVNLLVLDEAARIPDDLYRSVRPMLAVSRGRLVALSTPFGQHGWFYEEWHGNGPWKRVRITWRDCPRITPEFIEEETRALGPHWVDQEYNACFTALEGLVYPDFEQAVVELGTGNSECGTPAIPSAPHSEFRVPSSRRVGGIDFGWRNPFAALWGILDRDDVLWLEGERYRRETPLHEHAAALRALGSVQWYADPAGRTETEELRAANLNVRRGDNDIRLGIAAVTARLRTGRLKVPRSRCPQLLAEAKLYRYPTAAERKHHGEEPIDAHNHALAALRYLIAKLDARFVARLRKPALPSAERGTRNAELPLRTPSSEFRAGPDLWTPLT